MSETSNCLPAPWTSEPKPDWSNNPRTGARHGKWAQHENEEIVSKGGTIKGNYCSGETGPLVSATAHHAGRCRVAESPRFQLTGGAASPAHSASHYVALSNAFDFSGLRILRPRRRGLQPLALRTLADVTLYNSAVTYKRKELDFL